MTSACRRGAALVLVVAGALAASPRGDMTGGTARSFLPAQAAARPWFVDVTTDVGLVIRHENGASGQFQMAENLAPGAALFDADNDGDLDALVVQSGTLPPAPGEAAGPAAFLYRNDLRSSAGPSSLRFTDVTAKAALRAGGYGMGVAVGDYDGDGLVDVYLTSLGHNVLYRNRGGLQFEDVTARAGVDDPRWSTSAAFVDIDGDGHLDLYVANYLAYTPATNKPCFEAAGARDYCAPTTYQPVPDRLFRNRGDGTFEDVSEAAGITRAIGNGLGVAIGDYDADGHPDIYVANDATPNQLWRNLGNGRFEDAGPISGAAFNALGRPEGSMGIASGDVDHDGDLDLAITNIIGETFVFYRNDGLGGFEDDRVATGLAQPTSAMTGFGAEWLDANNDGVLDLVVVNGAVNVLAALRGSANPYRQRNQIFEGVLSPPDRGFRLVERAAALEPAFASLDVSRGLAVGDVDNDGWPDVLITNNDGPVQLLRNTAAAGHRWVGLDLRLASGSPAIGAAVEVLDGPAAGRRMRVRTDGSYLSASDPRLRIGVGAADVPARVRITWPDGRVDAPDSLEPGRYHARRPPESP